MAKEIRAFEANDGSLHKNECAAATRDLEMLLESSPLAENAPYMRKALDWLTDDPDKLMKALTQYARACPKATAERPALAEPEGAYSSEGPQAAEVGVDYQATERDLKPHMKSCQARATGYYKDCSCGAFSSGQIEEYRRLYDERGI